MTTTDTVVIEDKEENRPGRPPLSKEEPTVRKTVTFPMSYLSRIKALGDGQISPGVRRAVDLAEQNLSNDEAEGSEDSD